MIHLIGCACSFQAAYCIAVSVKKAICHLQVFMYEILQRENI